MWLETRHTHGSNLRSVTEKMVCQTMSLGGLLITTWVWQGVALEALLPLTCPQSSVYSWRICGSQLKLELNWSMFHMRGWSRPRSCTWSSSTTGLMSFHPPPCLLPWDLPQGRYCKHTFTTSWSRKNCAHHSQTLKTWGTLSQLC